MDLLSIFRDQVSIGIALCILIGDRFATIDGENLILRNQDLGRLSLLGKFFNSVTLSLLGGLQSLFPPPPHPTPPPPPPGGDGGHGRGRGSGGGRTGGSGRHGRGGGRTGGSGRHGRGGGRGHPGDGDPPGDGPQPLPNGAPKTEDEIEELAQQLAAYNQNFESQLSALMEENGILLKSYQDLKWKLQTVTAQMEGHITERKAREENLKIGVENLKAEIQEKSLWQARIGELEQQLALGEKQPEEKEDEIEELTQQLAAYNQNFESQLSALMEENGILLKSYQDLKWKLQTVTAQMEGHITERKAREENLKIGVENLKAEIQEKSLWQARIGELEQQLALGEKQPEEKEEGNSTKESEREATLKHVTADLEFKNHQVMLFRKELEKKLQLAATKCKDLVEGEKGVGLLSAELDEVKTKLAEGAECEIEIKELQVQLNPAKSKSAEQIKAIVHKDGTRLKRLRSETPCSDNSKHRKRRHTTPNSF